MANGPVAPGNIPCWREGATLALILALFIYLLSIFWVPAIIGRMDESAYLLTARQLAHGRPDITSPDPAVFLSENMVEVVPGRFAAKYPVGYPLLCAAAYLLDGADGPFWVNPIMAVLAIAGTFALARQFVPGRWALLAAWTLALHPLWVYYGTGALSHMSDTACAVWGLFFGVRWTQHGGWHNATLAGLLLGYAVSIRYTEALLVLPAGVLIVQRLRNTRARRLPWARDSALMLLAALVALGPLLWYQAVCFGSPLTTGYAFSGESSAFSLWWLRQHAWYALVALNRPGYGLVLIFPLAIAGLIFAAAARRWVAAFLTAWVLPTLILYIAYYWGTDGEPTAYLRFFLSLYPGLLIAALLPLDRVTAARGRVQVAVLGLLAAAALGAFLVPGPRQDLELMLGNTRWSEEAARLAKANIPAGSVILGDNWTPYFLVYADDWTLYYPDYFSAVWVRDQLKVREGGTMNAFNPLRARRFAAIFGGKSQVELNQLLSATLRQRCASGQRVFILTTAARAAGWQALFQGTLQLKPLASNPLEAVILEVEPVPATQPEPGVLQR